MLLVFLLVCVTIQLKSIFSYNAFDHGAVWMKKTPLCQSSGQVNIIILLKQKT